MDRLDNAGPGNGRWQRDLSVTYRRLAESFRATP
jgi:hypothetical protein